jgi:hypothetical protein
MANLFRSYSFDDQCFATTIAEGPSGSFGQ